MKILIAAIAFWFMVSGNTALGYPVVTVNWSWMPPTTGQMPDLYVPYMCRGVCSAEDDWQIGRDVNGNGVLFTSAVCMAVGDGVICSDSYEINWPPGETWSFALKGAVLDGRESVLSNIVTKTRPTTTTTTTTIPIPVTPPDLLDVVISPYVVTVP